MRPNLRLVVPDENDEQETAMRFRLPPPLPPVHDSIRATMSSMDAVSRRMGDLARQLNCLGHFDSDNDPPRAA